MKELNINNLVYVKLTDRGKKILEKDPIHSKYTLPNEDGFYPFQMWQLMSLFGSHMEINVLVWLTYGNGDGYFV